MHRSKEELLAQLKGSEERLRLAVESTGLGTWDWNIITGELRWSDRCKEIFGLSPEVEVTYDIFLERLHPEDRERTDEVVRQSLDPAGEGGYEIEYRAVWDDGTVRWIVARGRAFFEGAGAARRAIHFTGTALDITERKRADDELRESEARFRNLADNAPVMVWVTDPTGYCTYLSKSWYEFTGQTEETGLGFGWANAVHPEDQEASREIFLAANERREAFQLDYRLRNADGEYRWAIDAATPRFGADGEYLGFVGSVIDITERRQAEQLIKQSEEQFRTLADSIPQLAWMADADGSIFWYNRRWYDYTGTTFDEMEGWGWQAVHDPDEVERVTELFKHHVAAGEPWEDTFPLRSKGGEYRRFLSRALPIRDAAGRIVRWFGTNTDIEEQLRAEAKLRESEELSQAVLNSLPAHIAVLDRDGVIIAVNEAWRRFAAENIEHGAQPLESVGVNYLTVCMPQAGGTDEYARRAQAGIRAVLEGAEQSFTLEYPCHSPETERWFLLNVTPLPGARRGAVVSHLDITERKRAEQESQASEARYRALTDAMPQLVWATDENGSHFYYNQQWYDYTGLTEEESMGYGFANALHPEDKERTLRRWERAWRDGEGYSLEYRFYSRPLGLYRWFLGRATPVRDHEGMIVQWVGTCTDIDDQKQMEAELARISDQRERMLEEVSTPVVPLLPGVLALPLVGSLDTNRMQRATDAALSEVTRTGAHTCIIDITGARLTDAHAVANIGNLVAALKLIGADAIVTGVTAQAAQSLVGLGLDLSQIRTHRTLAQALSAVAGGQAFQGIGSRNNGTTIYTR